MTTSEEYIHKVLPTLNGWCTQQKATAMAEAVLVMRPTLCLEIGVFAGRSLFAVATALQQLGAGMVLGIEPWDSKPCVEGSDGEDENAKWWSNVDHATIEAECRDWLAKLSLETHCHLVKTTSQQFHPAMLAIAAVVGRPPLDFLHIDGNHSEEVSCADVELYVPLVGSGGEVWFDDTNWESTKAAQTKILESCLLIEQFETFARYRKR